MLIGAFPEHVVPELFRHLSVRLLQSPLCSMNEIVRLFVYELTNAPTLALAVWGNPVEFVVMYISPLVKQFFQDGGTLLRFICDAFEFHVWMYVGSHGLHELDGEGEV